MRVAPWWSVAAGLSATLLLSRATHQRIGVRPLLVGVVAVGMRAADQVVTVGVRAREAITDTYAEVLYERAESTRSQVTERDLPISST